ncbi:MAG: carboxypeptidase-like regulatory domain-containing protein [Acidobacteriota bacterium]|jgi:hypothetical protein|nr:carboxypeptidase-like regulatory domain-containing protein [Acidobacteriota bacterium]
MKTSSAFRKLAWLPLLLLPSLAPVPARAQGGNVVEGRIVNRTDPGIAAAGAEVEVIDLSVGMDIIKTADADAQGRFRIDGLPATGMPLLLRAIYKGVNYHGMLRFDAAGKATAQIEVYEPTTSMQGIQARSATLAFQLGGDHLHAVETWEIVNQTDPPRVYVNPEGSFRISKAAGILEPPKIQAAASGSEMPLTQSALESADGESYYSLYPLRPGLTTFEARQTLPYADKRYVYAKKFFMDAAKLTIGVLPADMAIEGGGIERTEVNAEEDFAIYSGPAVKAGEEVSWTLSGGTPVAESAGGGMGAHGDGNAGGATVKAMDGFVGRNALPIGSLLLLALVIPLWRACVRPPDGKP